MTVDVDTIYKGFEQVLPNVDYLITSSEFPSNWTGESDPCRALTLMQETFGMKVAAMTLGAHGALARLDGRFYYSPAFVVNCVDTTGAGDIFHGAFCHAFAGGADFPASLAAAAEAASLSCTAWGPRQWIAELRRRG